MTRDLEPEEFEIALKGILQLGASVNIYMFHGEAASRKLLTHVL